MNRFNQKNREIIIPKLTNQQTGKKKRQNLATKSK